MPIDPAGTKPGLQPQAPEQKKLNIRCKNKSCDSIEVVEIQIPNNGGRHLYRCVKCNTTWGVVTGGSVDLG
jgi:transposase-like protein